MGKMDEATRRRLGQSREADARANEMALCAAIQQACPELTRGQAMAEAVRILAERGAAPGVVRATPPTTAFVILQHVTGKPSLFLGHGGADVDALSEARRFPTYDEAAVVVAALQTHMRIEIDILAVGGA